MKPTATRRGSPAPSSPKSGATKRPRKATTAALSDVTNLLPETPTPTKPRRTGRRPLPQPSDASSTCSSPSASASVAPAPNRPSAASATVTPAPNRPSAAAVIQEECSMVKSPAISTVYARRGAAQAEGRGNRGAPTTDKDKGKGKGKEPNADAAAAAGTASCPQLGKATRNNNNRKPSMAQDTRPISSSAPCHEAKKKRPSSSTINLPEDFVKKQRAYFADVDAFELPEEEVSETDED